MSSEKCCESCEIFLQEKEKILANSDSVFDSLFDLKMFVKECRLTCALNNKIIVENNKRGDL